MTKKINMIIICCINLSVYASEKKPKDIYSLKDLKIEVKRVREEHNRNKRTLLEGTTTRGNRIDHEPTHQQSSNQTDKHT